MKYYISLLFIFVMQSVQASNIDSLKAKADNAYAHESFDKATKIYEEISAKGRSAEICYNLGNCYYRMDEIAKAVLWYERASLLNPSDMDIRFNLDMARSKTIDKVVPQHELFFVGWYHTIVNLMSLTAWACASIILFVCSLLSLTAYFFCAEIIMRKIGFFAFLVALVLSICGNVFALSQRQRLENRTGAIVMASAAVVKSSPSLSGSDLFILHEGTKVEITDDSLQGWYEVKLADGKVGWLQMRQIERI